MGYVYQYFAWFAGAGLIALLVFHPTLAANVLSGINNLVTKVTNLGQP